MKRFPSTHRFVCECIIIKQHNESELQEGRIFLIVYLFKWEVRKLVLTSGMAFPRWNVLMSKEMFTACR